MNEKFRKLYIKSFINYINKKVDFNKYENMIEKSKLFFSPSNSINKNINSNYYSLLNEFYFDKLDEKNKTILLSKNDLDEEVNTIVKGTYKNVLKKRDLEYVMYNPPMPIHRVKNGSLVFEFVYGKNSEKLDGESYVDNVKKQRDFINQLNEMLEKDIEKAFDIPCKVFVEKRF